MTFETETFDEDSFEFDGHSVRPSRGHRFLRLLVTAGVLFAAWSAALLMVD